MNERESARDLVRRMVEARFGGLLATDPNVSISTGPTA